MARKSPHPETNPTLYITIFQLRKKAHKKPHVSKSSNSLYKLEISYLSTDCLLQLKKEKSIFPLDFISLFLY